MLCGTRFSLLRVDFLALVQNPGLGRYGSVSFGGG